MNPTRTQKLLVGGAIALAATGGGVALAARGTDGHRATSLATPASFAANAATTHGPHGFGLLDAAVSYLGLTADQIRTQLEAGKTLAQIADATAGKSAAGLIDAIVAAEKQELAAAVSAGRLTQAQADQIAANLTQRVTDLVNSTPPNGGVRVFGHGPGDDLAAAASYLGIQVDALVSQLQSGKTLAQIADATSGKSAAGLIDALVAHEKQELADAVKAGRLTQAQADQIAATLQQRFTDLVNGTFPKHGPRGGGFGFRHSFFGHAPRVNA
jgi:hypothetical protein